MHLIDAGTGVFAPVCPPRIHTANSVEGAYPDPPLARPIDSISPVEDNSILPICAFISPTAYLYVNGFLTELITPLTISLFSEEISYAGILSI